MSSAADLVYKNTVWRIESIAPTCKTVGRKFTHVDKPLGGWAEQSSGTTRDFAVYFETGGPVVEPTDGTGFLRERRLVVEVAYSADLKLPELHELIFKDGYDLHTTLRDSALRDGISNSSPTTDTGLETRVLEEERLDRNSPTTWYLRQVYSTTIYEAE